MSYRMFVAFLLWLVSAQFIQAHDTWIEKRNGELFVLRGHGTEVEGYNPELVKEPKAVDLNGQPVQIEIVKHKENVTLVPKGNPAIVGALYDSGYWLKTTEGWKKATKREGKGKYEILESLKSKQWCKTFLTGSNESLKPLGQQFEIIPQKDPLTHQLGDKLFIKVIYDGKTVEGAIITSGGSHESDKKSPIKTDKEGTASIVIEKPGLQMLKASYNIPLKDDPDADTLHMASTITFEIR